MYRTIPHEEARSLVMFSGAALGAPDMPMKTRDLHGEAELVSSIGLSSRCFKTLLSSVK